MKYTIHDYDKRLEMAINKLKASGNPKMFWILKLYVQNPNWIVQENCKTYPSDVWHKQICCFFFYFPKLVNCEKNEYPKRKNFYKCEKWASQTEEQERPSNVQQKLNGK